MNDLSLVYLSGLCVIVGAIIYAISDVMLLAGKANIADYPNLQPHAKLLSGTERMVNLSWNRMMWGGLLGVFATPLMIAGLWSLYNGLATANAWLSFPPIILFALGFIFAPFVHGSFIYLGEYVQALNKLNGESQNVIIEMFKHHKQALTISYGAVAIAILSASLWFSVAVVIGNTRFPLWLAAINPITALITWMLVKKILPSWIVEHTEGAGFNIAFIIFFTCTTLLQVAR